MKIGVALDDRGIADRRELFRKNVASGKWYACVASGDLRYFIPITKQKDGRFEHSLPIEFRRLGIKSLAKKKYADVRRAAEDRIRQAAVVSDDEPPLITFFGPLEKKPTAWTRTKNVFDRQERASAGGAELKRFRPQEFGWRCLVRRVMSLDLTQAAKIVLLYAYDRGFESGQFFASSETISHDTGIHQRHVKRILAQLVKVEHLERLKQVGPKLVWLHAFLTPADEFATGDFKSPQPAEKSALGDLKSPPPVTLSPATGDLRSPKADKASRNDSIRTSTRRRVLAPKAAASTRREEELLAEIRAIDEEDVKVNGGLWRHLMRESTESLRAVAMAVEDWKIIRPDMHRGVKTTRGAWLKDRYNRAIEQIRRSNESCSAGA
jgi:hypothetical protein